MESKTLYNGVSMPPIFTLPLLTEIGAKYGKSAAQVVLRWNTQRGVIVIPKSIQHREAACSAADGAGKPHLAALRSDAGTALYGVYRQPDCAVAVPEGKKARF